MTAGKLMVLVRTISVPATLALILVLGVSASAGRALAGDCNTDIATLSNKRQGIIDELNKLAKGGKKQLDPVASCPKLRALATAEREFVAYLTKNKDWCNVPDEALQNLATSSSRTGEVASQACKVADQIKKAQQQQAAGAAGQPPVQKLPAGPL